jgi:hypothetical protein
VRCRGSTMTRAVPVLAAALTRYLASTFRLESTTRERARVTRHFKSEGPRVTRWPLPNALLSTAPGAGMIGRIGRLGNKMMYFKGSELFVGR